MSGLLLKGALVEFPPTFLVPLPNVILFQYNPETMTHTWSQPEPVKNAAGVTAGNPMTVRGLPGEEFSFTLSLDADDDIARGNPVVQGIAQVSGAYARLAALEMLLYPTSSATPSLLGTVSAAIDSASNALAQNTEPQAPVLTVPVVLFVWGAGRIVPVRVKSLSVAEKLYDATLNPTHVDATLSLRVLTTEELAAAKGDKLALFATIAYKYTQTLRQALATANLANSASAVIGMLPT